MICKNLTAKNPLIAFARENGVVWRYKRGHEYLYMPPGPAVAAGLISIDRGLMTDADMAIGRRAVLWDWAEREKDAAERERRRRDPNGQEFDEPKIEKTLEDIL